MEGWRTLGFIACELHAVTRVRDLYRSAQLLQLFIDRYYGVVYEARERLVGALVPIVDNRKTAEAMKTPAKRSHALSRVSQDASSLAHAVEAFFEAAEDDVATRNRKTHRGYVYIDIILNGRAWELHDALIEPPDEFKAIENYEALLRRAIRRMAHEYERKCRGTMEAIYRCAREFGRIRHDSAGGAGPMQPGI